MIALFSTTVQHGKANIGEVHANSQDKMIVQISQNINVTIIMMFVPGIIINASTKMKESKATT